MEVNYRTNVFLKGNTFFGITWYDEPQTGMKYYLSNYPMYHKGMQKTRYMCYELTLMNPLAASLCTKSTIDFCAVEAVCFSVKLSSLNFNLMASVAS